VPGDNDGDPGRVPKLPRDELGRAKLALPHAIDDSLAALQRRFFQLITAPDGVEKGLAALGLPRADLESAIAGDARASAVERLDVYANMYFFRIRDVLRDYFPKLAAVLGEAAFHNLAVDYLIAHPSRHPSLRYVGAALPPFLAGHPLAAERPWLSELAALEHARLDVFDRADVPLQTREALAALPPDAFAELALPLIPAHEVVPARHQVDRLWRIVDAGETAFEPPPARPGHALLVWRRGVTVYHRPVEPPEADGLALARDGASFGSLCAELARDADPAQAAQRAAALLGQWLADELLAAPA
jgi:hypothetical protein